MNIWLRYISEDHGHERFVQSSRPSGLIKHGGGDDIFDGNDSQMASQTATPIVAISRALYPCDGGAIRTMFDARYVADAD